MRFSRPLHAVALILLAGFGMFYGCGGGDPPKRPIAIPQFTSHPRSLTVTAGSGATLGVTATGENLSYQWYKNASPISGARATSFTITSTITGDSGSYYVVVSNTGGSVTSNMATLTVNAPPSDPRKSRTLNLTGFPWPADRQVVLRWYPSTGASDWSNDGTSFFAVGNSPATTNGDWDIVQVDINGTWPFPAEKKRVHFFLNAKTGLTYWLDNENYPEYVWGVVGNPINTPGSWKIQTVPTNYWPFPFDTIGKTQATLLWNVETGESYSLDNGNNPAYGWAPIGGNSPVQGDWQLKTFDLPPGTFFPNDGSYTKVTILWNASTGQAYSLDNAASNGNGFGLITNSPNVSGTWNIAPGITQGKNAIILSNSSGTQRFFLNWPYQWTPVL